MPSIDSDLIKAVQVQVGPEDYLVWEGKLAKISMTAVEALTAMVPLIGYDPRLLAAKVLDNLHSSSEATERKVGDITVKNDSSGYLASRAAALRLEVHLERLANFGGIQPWSMVPDGGI